MSFLGLTPVLNEANKRAQQSNGEWFNCHCRMHCKSFRTCTNRDKYFEHESIRGALLALRDPEKVSRGWCTFEIFHHKNCMSLSPCLSPRPANGWWFQEHGLH